VSAALRPPPIAARALVHAAVYGLAATMLVPLVWMVATSLKTDQEALGGVVRLLPEGPPSRWAWENYPRAIESARLGRFYLNSLAVAGLTTALGVAHNALAGFAFAKLRFPGRGALFAATLATMMLPLQVYFIFAYIIAGRLGFIDNVQALVVPFLASGFGIFYLRQAISTVPDALLEAGRLDGMTDLETFWHLVRPTIWPAVAALGIFTFIGSWNSFFWPLIVVDSDRAKTLPLAIMELAAGRYVQSWPVRMAAATIMTAPLILVFLVFQRAFVRGVALTGAKE
jgi:ABC-type glycerol-3-phosphate transport system permease component